ncbi:MAG TPA: response regulator [Chitinophagaceae bacterium]
MKKILIIDDNNELRDNISEMLELANYLPYTADNGKTGVELALQVKPDLIICDVMMPALDGYGVLYLLQKHPEIRNTPFIFLTAKTEYAEMRKGMQLGADDYITKPFEETDLLHAVECRLKKAEQLKESFAAELHDVNGYQYEGKEKDVLEFLSEDRNINKYKKKQVIYSEGNRPSRLYYIKKGKVKTFKVNEDGKELIVGLYNEGDFLGHVALLEGTTYKEMAEAMEDVELAVIPKEDFDELISTNREAAKKFISMMARSISENEEHLVGLAYNSLRKKVAEALVTLSKKYSSTITISRENLAAIAGTATESLIRTLSDFKKEDLIDIKEGAITIVNKKKLETLPY